MNRRVMVGGGGEHLQTHCTTSLGVVQVQCCNAFLGNVLFFVLTYVQWSLNFSSLGTVD